MEIKEMYTTFFAEHCDGRHHLRWTILLKWVIESWNMRWLRISEHGTEKPVKLVIISFHL
jgi:hypothetical protein